MQRQTFDKANRKVEDNPAKIDERSCIQLQTADHPKIVLFLSLCIHYFTAGKMEVNANKKYQSILGFGGAFTDAAGINIMDNLKTDSRKKLLEAYFAPTGQFRAVYHLYGSALVF